MKTDEKTGKLLHSFKSYQNALKTDFTKVVRTHD